MRPPKRKVLEAGPGVRMELLAWGNKVMEPHLFRISAKAGSGESYAHEGEEFLFVLRGELKIALDGEEYHLKRGDGFYFEKRHALINWTNPGRSETTASYGSTRRRLSRGLTVSIGVPREILVAQRLQRCAK